MKGLIMETQKAKFVTNRFWLNSKSPSKPVPASKLIPDWYSKGDRFFKDPNTQEYVKQEDGGKIPTWKACHSFMDSMISGYMLLTPCDIHFFINDKNDIDVRIDDKKNNSFCTTRSPMPQFHHPSGYYKTHFSWLIDWGVVLPEGYSALYLTPMNRFDLPFINTTGIIDNDKVHISGNLPFFLLEGWTGTLPAGTPFCQVFPFKRENWESEIVVEDPRILPKKNHENSLKYRIPDGGVYKDVDWERRSYQ
jgi:hypothetical protein